MDKQIYEISYWLRIESEPEKEEEKILNLIKNFNGEFVEKITPKKKQLSYPIDKQSLGYFGTIFFSAGPEVIIEIKKELKLYKNVLRCIIIKNQPTIQENRSETGVEAETKIFEPTESSFQITTPEI